MQIYMQITPQDDKPPRFYNLFIQQDLLGGWTLVREWGYQGSPGRMRREHHDSLEKAMDSLMQCRDTQLRRGYRVVFARGEGPPA